MNATARNIISNIHIFVALNHEVGRNKIGVLADKIGVSTDVVWDALRRAQASKLIWQDGMFGTFKATDPMTDRRTAYQTEVSLLAEKGFTAWSNGWLSILNAHMRRDRHLSLAA